MISLALLSLLVLPPKTSSSEIVESLQNKTLIVTTIMSPPYSMVIEIPLIHIDCQLFHCHHYFNH